MVYGLTRFIDTDELAMTSGANTVAATMGLTSVSALAYLFFNLYTPPCFAAIGAMNSEMRDRRWLWSAIGLQFCTGYTIAFLVNQVGTLVMIAVGLMALAIAVISHRIHANFAAQYNLHQQVEKAA